MCYVPIRMSIYLTLFLEGFALMNILLLSDRATEADSLVNELRSHPITIRKHPLTGLNSIPYGDYTLVILNVCGNRERTGDFLFSIRRFTNVPVFIMTNASSETTNASYYDLGADGIICADEDVDLLVSEMNAFLRRFPHKTQVQPILSTLSGVSCEPNTRRLFLSEVPVTFSKDEFSILMHLINNQSRVVPRDELKGLIKSRGCVMTDNALNIHIARIRKKCGFLSHSPIETHQKTGYRWNPTQHG
jgi:DNA-binding response OmpR family regulator